MPSSQYHQWLVVVAVYRTRVGCCNCVMSIVIVWSKCISATVLINDDLPAHSVHYYKDGCWPHNDINIVQTKIMIAFVPIIYNIASLICACMDDFKIVVDQTSLVLIFYYSACINCQLIIPLMYYSLQMCIIWQEPHACTLSEQLQFLSTAKKQQTTASESIRV